MESISLLSSSLDIIFQKPFPSTSQEVSRRFGIVLPKFILSKNAEEGNHQSNLSVSVFFKTFLKTLSQKHLKVNEEMFDNGDLIVIELSLMWALGLTEAVKKNVLENDTDDTTALRHAISETLSKLFSFASERTKEKILNIQDENNSSLSLLVKKFVSDIWSKHLLIVVASENQNIHQESFLFDALFVDVFDEIAKTFAEELMMMSSDSGEGSDDNNQKKKVETARKFVEAVVEELEKLGNKKKLENVELLKTYLGQSC